MESRAAGLGNWEAVVGPAEIGRQLASLLIQRIDNSALDFQVVRVKGQLREGQTVCRL